MIVTGMSGCDDGRTRVVVWTHWPDELTERVATAFESEHTDIDLRFRRRDDEATVREISEEVDDVDFDVWWGGEVTALERARQAGAVRRWQPLASTPYVVAFVRGSVGLADAPRDWIDVLHHGWADEVLLPDPSRTAEGALFVAAFVAEGVREAGSPEWGLDWLERLDGQVRAYPESVDEALRALRIGGSGTLAILPLTAVEKARRDDDTYYFRRPESGWPVFVRGVGISTSAKAPEAAERFVRFLASGEAVRVVEEAGWKAAGWEAFGAATEPSEVASDEAVSGVEALRLPVGGDTAVAVPLDSLDAWLRRWQETVRGRGL